MFFGGDEAADARVFVKRFNAVDTTRGAKPENGTYPMSKEALEKTALKAAEAGARDPGCAHPLAAALIERFAVVKRVRASGDPSLFSWQRSLPELVAELESRWSFKVRSSLGSGMLSVVLTGVHEGSQAETVLKLAPPGEQTTAELRALLAMEGTLGPQVFEVDVPVGAVLMERLGAPSTRSSLTRKSSSSSVPAASMTCGARTQTPPVTSMSSAGWS